jgi:protein SCO1/2
MAPAILLAFVVLLHAADQPSRLAVIRETPSFTLTTQTGEALSSRSLDGRVTLVSFIFTTCSGSCPITTSRMVQVQQALKAKGHSADHVRLLSITLDPVRDTPERLKGYMEANGIDAANWMFLTGKPEDVNKVVADWGMWVKPLPGGQLDHPARIFLVDKKARIREIYDLTFLRPAWVVKDIELLLAEP